MKTLVSFSSTLFFLITENYTELEKVSHGVGDVNELMFALKQFKAFKDKNSLSLGQPAYLLHDK